MPIKISKSLVDDIKLSENDQSLNKQLISECLFDKSGGECFLCGAKISEASDDLTVDHDLAAAEGGQSKLDNLNLVHSKCNSFKNNHESINVRPYLKLLNSINENGGLLNYGGIMQALDVQIKAIDFELKDDEAHFVVRGNKKIVTPVYVEKNKSGEFKFCFIPVEKENIFNDDECQPRSVKPTHLWQIYNDINRNPLHEQPAARLEKIEDSIKSFRLKLFDGQHKTLAFWLAERSFVVIKVYIDISKDAAVKLVNSVQAKIKKLPLSPFELSAKMSEEWQERISKYEEQTGTAAATEKGFISWVDKDERSRAKSAFKDALVQTVLDDEGLEISEIVKKSGQKNVSGVFITEATLKNKLINPLLNLNFLSIPFDKSQKKRDIECKNIVRITSILYEVVFSDIGESASPQNLKKAKRFSYQSSLNYFASVIRSTIGKKYMLSDGEEFMDRIFTDEEFLEIHNMVKRFANHPIWTVDFDKSEKTKAVENSLSKNQSAEATLKDIGLKPGYISGIDELPSNWYS